MIERMDEASDSRPSTRRLVEQSGEGRLGFCRDISSIASCRLQAAGMD